MGVIDAEFCETSTRNGIIWLATSIVGLFALIASIPAILHKRFGGKDSWIYFVLLTIGCICFTIAPFWWWMTDKCEDVENYNEIYLEAEFDTSPGPSLWLMWTALFMCICAMLITMLHICNRIRREYYPQQQQARNLNQSFVAIQ